MIVFKYLYYRVHKALENSSVGADYGAFIYIAIFFFIIAGFVQTYLEYSGLFFSSFLFDILIFVHPIVLQLLCFMAISIYTYFVFARKCIGYYDRLFFAKKWLNTHIKLWMIMGLPCLFFVICILFDIFILR